MNRVSAEVTPVTALKDAVTTGPAANYLLLRNYLASTRLNLQHLIWHKELHYNIHPAIPFPPSDKSRVADIATGTGIWALEVADEYPAARCDGFDISLGQSPPATELPSNVTMREWDMTDPSGPPAELQGLYDLVHVRLVLIALDHDAAPVIRNLFSLLKPGGWLQWDEADYERQKTARPGPATLKVKELMAERGQRDWCLNLPDWLRRHGFERVQRFSTEPDGTWMKFSTDTTVMLMDEIADMEIGEKKKLVTEVTHMFREEAANGAGLEAGKTVVIARKHSWAV